MDRSSDTQRLAAIWISNFTSPALLVAVSLVYLTSRYVNDLSDIIRWSALGLLLIVIAPGLAYVLASIRADRGIDFDMTNRADRPIPLMLACLGALIGGSIVSNRVDSPTLLVMSQILVAMLLLLTVITIVWKISIHTSTLTALVTLIVIFRGTDFLLLYLLLVPVAWARFYLQKHTAAQLIAGAILGVLVTGLAWLLLSN